MQSQKKYKRVVVKIGSSLFCSGKAKLDTGLLNNISSQISALIKGDTEVVIVSSGAIALGMSILKFSERPKELNLLQAAAAVGQNELMDVYRKFFKKLALNCAQLLLTWEDFSDRRRYLNAKNTLNTLLQLKSVPVVNENDTISTDEIKFGDNDHLSALVSVLVGADLLIMLSDVDGLLDKDKKLIKVVDKITGQLKTLASPTDKSTSVGGMITKIEAARIAVSSGIPCVIANGRKKDIIESLVRDISSNGTLFIPQKGLLDARKRWLAFGTKSSGKIVVDEGAKRALFNNKSLLAVGVIGCEGSFGCGDIVSVCDNKGLEFCRGKVGLSAKEVEKVKGSRFSKEIIHRDNIAIL
jgi:glutamate 5-kinase